MERLMNERDSSRNTLVDIISDPEVEASLVQKVLDRHHDVARNPDIRAAMRAKKGRLPVLAQQV